MQGLAQQYLIVTPWCRCACYCLSILCASFFLDERNRSSAHTPSVSRHVAILAHCRTTFLLLQAYPNLLETQRSSGIVVGEANNGSWPASRCKRTVNTSLAKQLPTPTRFHISPSQEACGVIHNPAEFPMDEEYIAIEGES